MAEYIFDVMSQTSKLDWAFPFQRTGAFPIDRSAVFSSLEDAEKYALGLDDNKLPRDERGLGGTSYVGQVISVYEAGEGDVAATVSAYIISPSRSLMKLAATTASGDIAADVADLQGKVSSILESINTINTEIAKKADTEAVNGALALKADASAVEAALAEKANAETVNAALDLKANAAEVSSALDLKANAAEVNEELAKKADSETVNAALDLKANSADVNGALALKANAADVYTKDEVYTKSEVESYVASEIGSAGHLNREIVEALPEVADANVDTIYMVKKSGGLVDRDHYEEYMVINGVWELIGDTFVDLSNYIDKDELAAEIETIEGKIDPKADKIYVDEELAKKVSVSEFNEFKGENAQVIENAIAEAEQAITEAVGAIANGSEINDFASLETMLATAFEDTSKALENVQIGLGQYKATNDAAVALKANTSDVNAALELKANIADVNDALDLKANIADVNGALAEKADKATTLAGYGIGDAYTKTEVDAALLLKASQQDHNELVDEVNKKANAADVYAKGETYSRQEIADLIADITGGESAADVLASLNTYIGQNDARVGSVEDRVLALENADDDNIIEIVKVAGVALEVTDKAVNIPAATAEAYGVVKTSDEIGLDANGALEIKSVNVNKFAQTEGEWLILYGGSSNI